MSSVALQRFAETGLTEAALRGADFLAYADDTRRVRIGLTVAAARQGERSLVYAYERELDHSGHTPGCESEEWRAAAGRRGPAL